MLILFSVVATLVMSLFSYICGKLSGKQFSEPELLNLLVKSSRLPLNPEKRHATGWFIHFCFGIIFGLILKWGALILNYSEGFLYPISAGIFAGLLGVIGWEIMFRLNPDPPSIKLKEFYLQLIIAHVIFSLIFVFLITGNWTSEVG